MGDWGFKISIPGVSVLSATTLQLVMSSSFNMLKAKLVGTTTGNVAHGLAYVPAYFAISKISATKAGIVGQNYFTAIPYCNATNFVSGGGGVNTVKYYIFYQEAA